MNPPPTTVRRQDIELLRILAAFGIVWFHTRARGGSVAYAGLTAFLILSVMLGGRSGDASPPDLGRVAQRARRLLLPWAIWFAVYAAYNLAYGARALPPRGNLVAAVMAGPSIHLWYLPFLFLCLLGQDVARARLPRAGLAGVGGAVAVAAIATAPFWRPVTLQLSYPTLQWAEAAIPVLVGVFLLNADALPRRAVQAVSAAMLGAALWVAARDTIGITLAIGLAACLVIASGLTAHRISANLRPLSDATFGIYLVHSLVHAELLRRVPMPNAALPWAVFGVSAVLVLAGRRLLPRWSATWS